MMSALDYILKMRDMMRENQQLDPDLDCPLGEVLLLINREHLAAICDAIGVPVPDVRNGMVEIDEVTYLVSESVPRSEYFKVHKSILSYWSE